jgi:hypothetical protein
MHVHPFEIVFSKGNYQQNPYASGIYSTSLSKFNPPEKSEIVINTVDHKSNSINVKLRPAIFRMKFASMYSHTGPEVFNYQMQLSAIDRALLLPVAPLEGSIDPQMVEMKKFFSSDERFFFAWSVSNDLLTDDIYGAALSAMKLYKIFAIKQNLTQTQINIRSSEGNKRFEAIIDSCTKLDLPLILHSGKSPLVIDEESGNYSTLDVLEKFNWKLANKPVILAHSASYGYSIDEIVTDIIPRLKKLIHKYSNIYIDISGVDVHALKHILEAVPSERILFGSDALYEQQWQRLVKLIYALEQSRLDLDDTLIRILSANPEKHIFKNRYKAKRDLQKTEQSSKRRKFKRKEEIKC